MHTSGRLVGMRIGRSIFSIVLGKKPKNQNTKNPPNPKEPPSSIILKKVLILFPEVIVVMTSQIFRNFGTIALKSECPKFFSWIPILLQSNSPPFFHSRLVQLGMKKNKNGKYSYAYVEHGLVFSLNASFYELEILRFFCAAKYYYFFIFSLLLM